MSAAAPWALAAATLAALAAGLGPAQPLLVSALGVAAFLGLALAGRARLLRPPAPRAHEVVLATVGALALAAAAAIGGVGSRLAGGLYPPTLRLVPALATLAVAALALAIAPARVAPLVSAADTGAPVPDGRRAIAAVLIAGIAFHGLVLFSFPPFYGIDSYANLWEPDPFVASAQHLHHTPLYNEVVKFFGGGERAPEGLAALVALQHAAVVAIALLVERTVRSETGSALASGACGVAVALDGHIAAYAQMVMSEVPSLLLAVLAAVLLVESARRERAGAWVLAAGLVCALSTLARQVMEGWFALGAGWLLAFDAVRPRARAAAIFVAGALLPLAALLLHNHVYYGRAVLTAATGRNVLYRALGDMPRPTDPDAPPGDEFERARGIMWDARDGMWLSVYVALHQKLGWTDEQIDGAAQRVYFEQMRRHPWRFARVTLEYAGAMLSTTETFDDMVRISNEGHGEDPPRAWQRIPPAPEPGPIVRAVTAIAPTTRILVLALAAIAPLVALGRARRLAFLATASAAYFIVLPALVEAPCTRYRLPAIPFMLIAASVALVGIVERVRARARSAA
jgi:hypothetical protein